MRKKKKKKMFKLNRLREIACIGQKGYRVWVEWLVKTELLFCIFKETMSVNCALVMFLRSI